MSQHIITVTDPDDPMGMPAYDGPADKAGDVLAPGTYEATDDRGLPLILLVTDNGSANTRKA